MTNARVRVRVKVNKTRFERKTMNGNFKAPEGYPRRYVNSKAENEAHTPTSRSTSDSQRGTSLRATSLDRVAAHVSVHENHDLLMCLVCFVEGYSFLVDWLN